MNVTGKKSLLFKIYASLVLAVLCAPIFADSSYTVKKGDTLYSISKRYELTVAELRTANNLSEDDVIKAGQKLIIPTANISNAAALSATQAESAESASGVAKSTESYTVQKGDTLYSIARRHNMQLYDLLAVNNLSADSVIKVGQVVKVSAKNAASASGVQQGNTAINAQTAMTGDSSLLWPVENPRVVYIKGKVSGVELSAQKDEPVKSIRSGTVMYTGMYRGYGNIVFVESKTGLIYAYSWLGSVSVKKGDYVVCGDTVGTAGKDDKGSPRLTFMVFQNGMPIDPAKAPRG
ncbi:MAG: M23 family metallopeptidase [Treponema sp.]|nr:M23 family metallopeptidase [Treponema sp.]